MTYRDNTTGGSKIYQGTSQVLHSDEDNDFPHAYVESSPTGMAEGSSRAGVLVGVPLAISPTASIVKPPYHQPNAVDELLAAQQIAEIEAKLRGLTVFDDTNGPGIERDESSPQSITPNGIPVWETAQEMLLSHRKQAEQSNKLKVPPNAKIVGSDLMMPLLTKEGSIELDEDGKEVMVPASPEMIQKYWDRQKEIEDNAFIKLQMQLRAERLAEAARIEAEKRKARELEERKQKASSFGHEFIETINFLSVEEKAELLKAIGVEELIKSLVGGSNG